MLKQLDEDRFIVKASSGPRYVVGCRNKLDKAALKPGTRVSLDMTTLTIMRKLPREVRASRGWIYGRGRLFRMRTICCALLFVQFRKFYN